MRYKQPQAEAKSKWILWSKWPAPFVHPLAWPPCPAPAGEPRRRRRTDRGL